MKDKRQRAILTLVATRPVRSQEELAQLLDAQGIEATQATISRDIKDLGLAKVPIKDGQFKYVVPSPATAFTSRLHRVVAELVSSVTTAENLIVLKTPPGSAMLVATAIDEAAWPEVAGTIGGDDTVVAIVRSKSLTPRVAQRFEDLRESA